MAHRKCAFCPNHGKLTDEHAWPKWLHDVLPLELKSSHHNHLTIRPGFGPVGSASPIVTRTRRSGDPGSRKLPIACSECNTRWMSRLQNRAKEILIPIIRGQWVDLREDAEIVARWCVMTTMVYEYIDPMTIAIPQNERDRLRDNTPLSDRWTIWIGQCPEESPNRRAAHRAYRVVEGPMTTGKPNAQVTTLHVGNMLAQVIFGTFQDHGSNVLYSLQTGMKLLHPRPSSTLDTQPRCMGDGLIEFHQARLTDFFEVHAHGIRTLLMPEMDY